MNTEDLPGSGNVLLLGLGLGLVLVGGLLAVIVVARVVVFAARWCWLSCKVIVDSSKKEPRERG